MCQTIWLTSGRAMGKTLWFLNHYFTQHPYRQEHSARPLEPVFARISL
jgi:hypothetical protein